MKDRFKIVVGIPKSVEVTLNEWAESEPGSKLKRTQVAGYDLGSQGAQVIVLCTYEPPFAGEPKIEIDSPGDNFSFEKMVELATDARIPIESVVSIVKGEIVLESKSNLIEITEDRGGWGMRVNDVTLRAGLQPLATCFALAAKLILGKEN